MGPCGIKRRVWLIIFWCVFVSSAYAQSNEYAVKAAFLERFTRFVEWPSETQMEDSLQPFIIGIFGDNPFGKILDETFPKTKIKNKPVQIRFIHRAVQCPECHLVFIPKSSDGQLQDILDAVRHKPVLTVSESAGSAEKGILINFYTVENKIRFEINEKAVHDSRLAMSYLLLSHGRIIESSD